MKKTWRTILGIISELLRIILNKTSDSEKVEKKE
jgi:hypothetical protein